MTSHTAGKKVTYIRKNFKAWASLNKQCYRFLFKEIVSRDKYFLRLIIMNRYSVQCTCIDSFFTIFCFLVDEKVKL